MEKLSERKNAVLDVLDEQIAVLEKRLQKVQPLVNELNQLKATRRTLLSERGVTGGAGNGRVQLSMESVIHYLREHGPAMPQDISEALGVPGATVRSHLNRNKDIRYQHDPDEGWSLIGEESDDDE